jgi:hypothetical protein
MKLLTFSLICLLSLGITACQQDRGVQAGREDGTTETYQPRPGTEGQQPAQRPGAQTDQSGMANQELRGQVMRVNAAERTIMMRDSNGMQQTVKYDDNTMISGAGLDMTQKPGQSQSQMHQNLIKNLKPGTEVVVLWTGDANNRVASSINVTKQAPKTNQK